MFPPKPMTAPNSFSADLSVGRRRLRKQLNQCDPATRCLAIMNLALCGIETDIGPENADTFRGDLHPNLRSSGIMYG